MTRADIRFCLALIVLAMDGALLASLIYMAINGKHVTGDNILFMASGVVLGWGGMVLHSYFGTTEGASRGAFPEKVEVVNPPERPVPVHGEEQL